MSAPAVTPAKKASKAKLLTKPATHPKFSEMIIAAVADLKEKKGSSTQAIKKYILTSYMVKEKSVATYVKTNLRRMVESGTLVQVKGSGASGFFKLAEKPKVAKPKKATAKKVVKKVQKAVKSPGRTAKTPTKSVKKPVAKKAVKKPTKKAATTPAKKPAAVKPAAKKAAKK